MNSKEIKENSVVEKVQQHLPLKRNKTVKGWIAFNCPACQYNGEPTPDKKGSGHIIFNNSSFTYNCFRCKFKAHYNPKMYLTPKIRKFLEFLDVPKNEIDELSLKAIQIREFSDFSTEQDPVIHSNFFFNNNLFTEIQLPESYVNITEDIEEIIEIDEIRNTIEYVMSRGGNLINRYEFFWSAEMPKRVIIPLKFKDKIVGYQSRSIDNISKKYINHLIPENYLFNMQYLLDSDRKYLIVVEGIFDAMMLNAVSPLGSSLSENQISWLKQSNKEIIIVPDKDNAGKNLVRTALENNWHVSMPDWHRNFNDVSDSVKEHGVIWTMKEILDNKTKNEVKIQQQLKLWFRKDMQ